MLDVQNPVQTAMTGLTQGMQVGQFVQAKELAEKEQLKKEQMQQELSTFASKPNKTHEDYATIMARFPALAEDFKRSYDVLDSGKQQATFKTASRIYAAASGNRYDLAKSILETEAVGYENSGDTETAGHLRQMAAMAETDPESLKTLTGLTLASTNPSQFKDVLGALNQNQALPNEIELKRAQTAKAKAETEKTKTENLWYGDKTQAEINNLESQVEDRQTGRVLQQQDMQLKNDQFYTNLDQNQLQFYENLNQEERKLTQTIFNVKEKPQQRMERLEKVNKFAGASANTAKLAAELANDPNLSNYTGGYWNRVMRSTPGTDEYNFAQKIKTLESQAFLIGAEGLKGLGAMTETEGAKVTVALGNLNPSQDVGEFQRQLAAIARAASSVSKTANKNAQIYSTKGKGYSAEVVEAAKARGVSPAEMQQVANQLGIE